MIPKVFAFLTAALSVSMAVTATADDEVDGGAKFCVTPYLQHPATNAMTILFFTDRACVANVSAWLANGTAGPTAADPLVLETRGEWASALTNNVAIGLQYDNSVWTNSLYRHRARF